MSRQRWLVLTVLVPVAAAAFLSGGCAKKVTPPPAVARTEVPPPAPEPPRPAPRLSLSASPSTIERGQSTTLSWSSSNASSVSIDGGIGTVEPAGSRTITPAVSTTYRATASGAGGNATSEARVTVTEPVAPPPPVTAKPLTDVEFFATYVKDIYFDYDQYSIREDARSTLQSNARVFAERQGMRFTIEGHCDERGSDKYNLALGDRRANSARQFLMTQGVSQDRIDIVSYGKERPVCAQQTEDCWQKNRRAHFVQR